MSINKKLLVIATAGVLAFAGCRRSEIEYSQELSEPAKVLAKIHTPSKHELDVGLRLTGKSGGFGFGTSGFGYNVGCLNISSSEIPEKWGVLFRCQHGEFTSQGSDSTHSNLWAKLNEGQSVDVKYKEVYRTTYEGTNLFDRVLIKYDFIDAFPLSVEKN